MQARPWRAVDGVGAEQQRATFMPVKVPTMMRSRPRTRDSRREEEAQQQIPVKYETGANLEPRLPFHAEDEA